MRMSIATKIYIAFTGVTVMFTGLLMFGIFRTQDLYNQIQTLNHRIVPLVLTLSDVQTDLKSFHVVLNERDPVVLRRTLQFTRHIYFLPERFIDRLDDVADMATHNQFAGLSDSEIGHLTNVHQQILQLKQQAEAFAKRSVEFSDLVLNDDLSANSSAYNDEISQFQNMLREEVRLLDSQLTVLRNDLRAATDYALARANDNERSSLYAMGILSAIAFAVAILLLIVILFTVRPLSLLAQGAKRIGEGDYRPLSNLHQRARGNDEIALLAREFNAMATNLAQRDALLRHQHSELLKSERLATIGRMTSLITHELRNPLSSINLNSEMLMDSLVEHGVADGGDDIMPLLETIIEEVDRLRDITEEYLVYARLPSPKLDDENLGDIIQGLVDFHHWEWEQQQVDVVLNMPDEPIEIFADGNQMRQALLNLIKNAVEASPANEHVDVIIGQRNSMARIHIKNKGPAISPELQERLFEPFFTTKSHGTGLGLPMTQQIIEHHRGTIEVYSSAESGTEFIIELPLSLGENTRCAS